MKSANGYFNATMLVSLGISAFIVVVLIGFADFFVTILGANSEGESMATIAEGTKAYIIGLTIGIPFQFLVRLLPPIMQIDGDRERVMPAAMAGAATNVLGDFANVFILH